MFSITLHEAKFFAYHGLYPEEHLTGNWFRVSIRVDFPEGRYKRDDLNTSVNYEQLMGIASKRMGGKPYLLLEDMVQDMMQDVFEQFSFCYAAHVRIEKLNPVLGGETGAAIVELERKKNQ